MHAYTDASKITTLIHYLMTRFKCLLIPLLYLSLSLSLSAAICGRGSFYPRLLSSSVVCHSDPSGRWSDTPCCYWTVCGRGLNEGERKKESKAKTDMI